MKSQCCFCALYKLKRFLTSISLLMVMVGKTYQLTLPGNSYRIFIEGLKSPVTKAAYSYALQKYMKTGTFEVLYEGIFISKTPLQNTLLKQCLRLQTLEIAYLSFFRFLLSTLSSYDSNLYKTFEYHNFPLFAIKTTPVIIIAVAIIICGVIASLSIAHPKITATTGLT